MAEIEVFCLANSPKSGGRCVAGFSFEHGFVRLVGDADGAAIDRHETLLDTGVELQPLDGFFVDLGQHVPLNFQLENWLFTPGPFESSEALSLTEDRSFLLDLCRESPVLLEDDSPSVPVASTKVNGFPESITLVHVQSPTFGREPRPGRNPRYFCEFTFGGVAHNLALTDEKIKRWIRSSEGDIDTSSEWLLTISLGEPYGGFHYKLVASAIELPPIQEQLLQPAEGLPEAVEQTLGIVVAPSIQRFLEGDWFYQGSPPLICGQCESDLEVFRRHYESSGKSYRYWAVICPSCAFVEGLDAFDAATKKALRDWSESLDD